jgi:hypothetical protein
VDKLWNLHREGVIEFHDAQMETFTRTQQVSGSVGLMESSAYTTFYFLQFCLALRSNVSASPRTVGTFDE